MNSTSMDVDQILLDYFTINALFNLLQAFIKLPTLRNAQNAKGLVLDQYVAIEYSTDNTYLLTYYLLFLLIYLLYNLTSNIKNMNLFNWAFKNIVT